jgi:hypothetical protein
VDQGCSRNWIFFTNTCGDWLWTSKWMAIQYFLVINSTLLVALALEGKYRPRQARRYISDSTLSLVAIMLGCLRMTVQEVQDEVIALGHALFSPSRTRHRDFSAPYDLEVLREHMKLLLYRRGLDIDLKMVDSRPGNSRARV